MIKVFKLEMDGATAAPDAIIFFNFLVSTQYWNLLKNIEKFHYVANNLRP